MSNYDPYAYRTQNKFIDRAAELKDEIFELWQDGKRPDIISDAGQEYKEVMKKADILKQHPYAISRQYDGRYITYFLNKETGKRVSIRKKSLEDLEDALVSMYLGIDVKKIPTLSSLYDEWMEYRDAIRNNGTVKKDAWIWEKYYAGTDIAEMDIRKMNVPGITKWLVACAQKFSLTKVKFREMKGLLNQMLDYAVQMQIINRNPAREIHGISDDKFTMSEEKDISEQVFLSDDLDAFVDACEELYSRQHNMVYIALALNFHLGLRVGELAAIKPGDINFGRRMLTITRSESVQYSKLDDGKYHKSGVVIVPHLKKGVKQRVIPLSDNAIRYFRFILAENRNRGLPNEWLFYNCKKERMRATNVNTAMERVSALAGTNPHGNHSIRRTVISKLAQSRELTDKEIQAFAGHKDYATTTKYYEFALSTVEDRVQRINKVL